MKTSIEDIKKQYHVELDRLVSECQKIQKMLPSCQVYFKFDNFFSYVVVEGAERKDLHKLAKEEKQHFFFTRTCSGFLSAFNDKEVFDPDNPKIPKLGSQRPKVPIYISTKMRCRKCEQNQRTSVAIVQLLLKTNVRASIWRLWRFLLGNFWVGRGYNPDYTQVCTNGDCVSLGDCYCKSKKCNPAVTCAATGVSCGCPPPLPNSYVSLECSVPCSSLNDCKIASEACSVDADCRNPVGCFTTCLTGVCGYDCNNGYTWNGVACVAAVKPSFKLKARIGDARSKLWFRKQSTMKVTP